MIDLETKQDIITDLALDVKQSEIVKKHKDKDISQQSISYLKKCNLIAIEKLRGLLLDKLAKSFISRAIKESNKADKIVEHYNDDTLEVPNKVHSDYLAKLDNKIASQLKGIISPHTESQNINITKNETVTNINGDVLKMFQRGAAALQEVDAIET